MYKRACLLLVVIVTINSTLKPMDMLLRPVALGCQPLAILQTLWLDYKPYVYTSAAFLVGGFFVYDFITKRQQIKKLEVELNAVKNDKTTTAILAHVKVVENRIVTLVDKMEIIDKDLTYLWKFIFTAKEITRYNKIENQEGPYIMRPHIPQLDGFTIRDIIKEVCSMPVEVHDQFRLRPLTLNSPRSKSPFQKPVPSKPHSPVSSPSDSSDEEESLKKKKKKVKSKIDLEKKSSRQNSPRSDDIPKKTSPRKIGDE